MDAGSKNGPVIDRHHRERRRRAAGAARQAGRGREIPIAAEGWAVLADFGRSAEDRTEDAELFAALREEIGDPKRAGCLMEVIAGGTNPGKARPDARQHGFAQRVIVCGLPRADSSGFRRSSRPILATSGQRAY
jgi:hypothetical protein